MGVLIKGKFVVGKCGSMSNNFKTLYIEEVKNRDTERIIENIKVKRNSRNGDIEVHLEMNSDGREEQEVLWYVSEIILSSAKKIVQDLGIGGKSQ